MRRLAAEILAALVALTLGLAALAPAGPVAADEGGFCGTPPERAPAAPHCPACLPPALDAAPACAPPARTGHPRAAAPAAARAPAPFPRNAGPAAIRAPPAPSPA